MTSFGFEVVSDTLPEVVEEKKFEAEPSIANRVEAAWAEGMRWDKDRRVTEIRKIATILLDRNENYPKIFGLS
jgi:hypothetical protein